ncbi:MAG: Clp protease N-terminal domain-containing protein, partial [Pseudomonadota bacterium]
MNFDKFTERARGFVQSAQTIALREEHQRFLPDHILKALLDDAQGFAANLIKRAGGDPAVALGEIDRGLAKIAKVSGDASSLYMDGQTAKVLAE